jgi:hypothetical protein
VLSGLFFLVVLPPLRRLLFGKAPPVWLAAYAAYSGGLLLGSAGLLYATASRIRLQREAWIWSGAGVASSLKSLLQNLFSPTSWDFYHVSTPIALLFIATLIAFLVERCRRVGALIASLVLINVFYVVVHSQMVAQLRNRIGGPLKSFQFERFYFVISFLVVVAWICAAVDCSPRVRRILLAFWCLQMVCTAACTPHLQNPVRRALGMSATVPNFKDFAREADYKPVRDRIGNAATISIGLDPMAAVMNHIVTLDGYYNAYPLRYKSRFRTVIAKQLQVTKQEGYFDNWGNRIYTFAISSDRLSIDFCAAYRLGARFVISSFTIPDPLLKFEITTPGGLILYSISC